jgi:hypothetical protein
MDRREFLGLLSKGAFGAVALGIPLTGCNKETEDRTINVNGLEYQIKDGVLSQITRGDGQIKLGVMSDLHGNHEQTKTYSKALKDLTSKYPNVVDMEKVPVADIDDLTIVALGGNDNPRFNVPEGYLLNREDFERLGELAKQYQSDKPLLVATHVPQKYQTKRGLDVIDRGGINVGSEDLARVREAIGSNFAVSGHIHEAYGIITSDEQPVRQGELSDRLDFNPGPVYDHLRRGLSPAAGIIEFKDGNARAYILNR